MSVAVCRLSSGNSVRPRAVSRAFWLSSSESSLRSKELRIDCSCCYMRSLGSH